MPPLPPKGYAEILHHQSAYFSVDYHNFYVRFQNYPFGLLDVVGYWAETQLFGGVLLFDRGHSGYEVR